jgi:hypothetical protein
MSNASRYLQRIAFILLCVHGSISATAQQNWFLFIQSESNQPFYVRIGETIHSSSSVGHLIINGLRDSTYRLAIGFPQSQYREQQFFVPVRKKDHGFELKKTDGRSWILYDWLDQETIKSPRSDSLLYGERKKDDGFASLMAAVVKDSAVLYASVVKAEPPKKIEKTEIDSAIVAKIDSLAKDTVVKAEPVVVKTETPKPDSVVKDTIALVVKEQDKTPPVTKLNEQTGSEEKKLVFLDNTIGIKKDTITIIIPLEKSEPVKDTTEKKKVVVIKEEKPEPEKNNTAQSLMDSVAALKKTDSVATVKAEMKKIDSVAIAPAKEPEPEKPMGLILLNSDCVKFAKDLDVDKLRIKMMNEKDPGNRIFIAHKVFKTMCFATSHIKGLSELFPGDELKFRFFETAWPFVSDTSQFKTLEVTLTDSFFITRFRTLLRRQ